jgi:hypothetical protein
MTPLTSEMGRIQVDFYLILLSGIALGAAALLITIGLKATFRLGGEPHARGVAALIGGALVLAAVFVVGLAVSFALGIVYVS